MKLLIELDEEYVKAIDKIKFLVGGRTERKLQLEIIKAIKNGKALEQEPQSFKWCTDCKEYDQEKHCCHRYSKVIRDTVDEIGQEPKTGHWIDIMVGDMPAQACDQCNTFYPLAYTGGGHKYCPNCGARMVEPQEVRDKE